MPDDFANSTITTAARVSAQLADDHGNSKATATAVALGASIKGTVVSNDFDWLKVDLVAGTTYTFALEATDLVSPFIMAAVDDAGQSVVAPTFDSRHHFSFTPQRSGSYFLEVSQGNGRPDTNYTFMGKAVGNDLGATPATAGKIAIGTVVDGHLERGGGDRDWFAVTLQAGKDYAFYLDSPLLSYQWPASVRIIDALGAVKGSATSAPSASRPALDFRPATGGTYYVEVSSRFPESAAYSLRALDSGADVGDTAATAGLLAEGQWQASALDRPGDMDSFKFNVVAGNTYAVELSEGVSVSEPMMSLWITGANGESPPQYYYRPTGPGSEYTTFLATATGEYRATVSGQANIVGGYSIRATSLGVDDAGLTFALSAVMPADGIFKGALSFILDRDLVRVQLVAHREYVFELLGRHAGGGTMDTAQGSSFFILDDVGGPAIPVATANSAVPRLEFVAPHTGNYYLSIDGFAKSTGSYTVRMKDVTDDISAPVVTGQSVAHGANGVSLTDSFVFSFSEDIKASYNAVSLRNASGNEIPLAYPDGSSISVAIGNKITIDPVHPLQPGTQYTLQLIETRISDLANNALGAPKTLTFTTKPAVLAGSGGDDLLQGSGKGRQIAGEGGVDTAYYGGLRADFSVTRAGSAVTVQQAGAASGDSLTGVERLLFADGAVAIDIAGNGGQAYRLYQAAFDRVPDQAGVGFWMAQMDKGMALRDVAKGFVASTEFQQLYGAAPTNAQFVSKLYSNVLHRPGEQAGVDFWVGALNAGVTREEALAQFSESAENQAGLAGVIGNGFAYIPF